MEGVQRREEVRVCCAVELVCARASVAHKGFEGAARPRPRLTRRVVDVVPSQQAAVVQGEGGGQLCGYMPRCSGGGRRRPEVLALFLDAHNELFKEASKGA